MIGASVELPKSKTSFLYFRSKYFSRSIPKPLHTREISLDTTKARSIFSNFFKQLDPQNIMEVNKAQNSDSVFSYQITPLKLRISYSEYSPDHFIYKAFLNLAKLKEIKAASCRGIEVSLPTKITETFQFLKEPLTPQLTVRLMNLAINFLLECLHHRESVDKYAKHKKELQDLIQRSQTIDPKNPDALQNIISITQDFNRLRQNISLAISFPPTPLTPHSSRALLPKHFDPPPR